MKRIVALLLIVFAVFLLCSGCSMEKKMQSADLKPDMAKLKSICNLATLECYYHNVAKSETQGLFDWEIMEKKYWVEYTGTVRIGIDFSEVQCDIQGNRITITLPEAKVLDIGVDENSFNDDSTYHDNNLLSGKTKADEQTEAIRSAQLQMQENVQANKSLLSAAQSRAKRLIENYFDQIGALSDTDYEIQWINVPSE